ncbi:hypothetical protein E8E11_010623 [Didymella keratinophila]|nr:hypothetical protein E8E11_010623 [Didymella keratinophila]
MFDIFMEALADRGSQIDTLSSPASSDLILDANYDKCTEEVFGHITQPRRFDVVGLKGTEFTIANEWKTLTVKNFVRVPSSSICLFKRSDYSYAVEANCGSTCSRRSYPKHAVQTALSTAQPLSNRASTAGGTASSRTQRAQQPFGPDAHGWLQPPLRWSRVTEYRLAARCQYQAHLVLTRKQ